MNNIKEIKYWLPYKESLKKFCKTLDCWLPATMEVKILIPSEGDEYLGSYCDVHGEEVYQKELAWALEVHK